MRRDGQNQRSLGRSAEMGDTDGAGLIREGLAELYAKSVSCGLGEYLILAYFAKPSTLQAHWTTLSRQSNRRSRPIPTNCLPAGAASAAR